MHILKKLKSYFKKLSACDFYLLANSVQTGNIFPSFLIMSIVIINYFYMGQHRRVDMLKTNGPYINIYRMIKLTIISHSKTIKINNIERILNWCI